MNAKTINFRMLALVLTSQLLFMTSAVIAAGAPWQQAERIVKGIVEPIFPDREFPVTDFGAV